MTAAPRVSIIVPTYNRAPYISRTLESINRQTFRDFEVIVVDDGSTDSTMEVLAPFKETIRYIYQENRGEASARNRGIREARGEWIAFLDSDDMWEPHALETLLQTAERHPDAGLIAMKGRVIRTDGSLTNRIIGKKTSGPYYSTESLLWGDSGGVLMPMIRRDLFRQVGSFDENLSSATDCDMWIRISFFTRMVCVQEPLLLCRAHEESLSADKALNARMWLVILSKLRRDHPEFLRAHPLVYRRALGKENLRLGRELLAHVAGQPGELREARRRLAQSIRVFPFFMRAYIYLIWSFLFPTAFSSWRRWERRNR